MFAKTKQFSKMFICVSILPSLCGDLCFDPGNTFAQLISYILLLTLCPFSPHYVLIYVLILAAPLDNLQYWFYSILLLSRCPFFDPGNTIRIITILLLSLCPFSLSVCPNLCFDPGNTIRQLVTVVLFCCYLCVHSPLTMCWSMFWSWQHH